MSISINETLDPKNLAKDFSPSGRVQIKGFLPNNKAEKIYTALATQTPWQFTYNDGEDIHHLTTNDIKNMISRRRSDLSTNIFTRAREQFQFALQDYPLAASYEKKMHPDLPLYEVHEFLNSKEFLGFVGKVTGLKKLTKAFTRAIFFNQEQFCTENDGQNADKKNKIGFHLVMAKNWDTNWGGHHNFFGEGGNIELGIKPEFNALTLFKLPQNQSIGYVAPYVGTARFSINGYIQID